MINKKLFLNLNPSLWLIIILSSLSLLFCLFVSLVFFTHLENDNLKVHALAVPNINDTKQNFHLTPLNDDTYQSDRDFFIQKYITEYLVARYTVSGTFIAQADNLPINLTSASSNIAGILQQASFLGRAQGQILWTDAYKNLINKKDGELEEIERLTRENITRSVRIITPPKKDGDWWRTQVEFIYKSPTTLSLSTARTERYEISVDISSYHKLNDAALSGTSNLKNASSIFLIKINHLRKVKL